VKIAKLIIKNFRGLKDVNVAFDDSLNIIIGKNDVGKSTVLEAMEIFFNNSTVKLDVEDLCKFSDSKFIEIGISFKLDNYALTIDTIPTAFDDEFLLDSEGLLTIIKRWDCSKATITKSSQNVFLKANYPVDISNPYINLKSSDLKNLIKDNFGDDIPESVKLNTNSTMRLALYDIMDCSTLRERLIPLDKEDAKKVWSNLESDIPLFFLFQSDRANKDSDKDVQDPLKAMTKLAIKEAENELNEVVSKIEKLVTEVGQNTIEKMHDMNPELADSLTPDLSHKNWDSLFSFSFIGDDGIPINKRGSGFRRLLLLNFFRAEAEREGSNKPIIYAIEEPETALHPNWQLMLINSLVELAGKPNIQIFMSTHSPSLASQVDYEYIRYIHKSLDADLVIEQATENNFKDICETLGILPTISLLPNNQVRVAVCLEGPNDVEFFYNISRLFGFDFERDQEVLIIPLGGGTLEHWVNRRFLDKLNIPQVHIYDNDVSKYQNSVDEINSRKNDSWASLTKFREIENYVHPSLVRRLYSLDCDYFINEPNWKDAWGEHDFPNELSLFLKKLKSNGADIRGEGPGTIKRVLCERGAALMDKDLLEDLGVYEEVEGWFEVIRLRIR